MKSPTYTRDAHDIDDEWSRDPEPYEIEDMKRLKQALEDKPFGGSLFAVPKPEGKM